LARPYFSRLRAIDKRTDSWSAQSADWQYAQAKTRVRAARRTGSDAPIHSSAHKAGGGGSYRGHRTSSPFGEPNADLEAMIA